MSDGYESVKAPGLPEPVGHAHAVVAAPGRAVFLGGHTAMDAGLYDNDAQVEMMGVAVRPKR